MPLTKEQEEQQRREIERKTAEKAMSYLNDNGFPFEKKDFGLNEPEQDYANPYKQKAEDEVRFSRSEELSQYIERYKEEDKQRLEQQEKDRKEFEADTKDQLDVMKQDGASEDELKETEKAFNRAYIETETYFKEQQDKINEKRREELDKLKEKYAKEDEARFQKEKDWAEKKREERDKAFVDKNAARAEADKQKDQARIDEDNKIKEERIAEDKRIAAKRELDDKQKAPDEATTRRRELEDKQRKEQRDLDDDLRWDQRIKEDEQRKEQYINEDNAEKLKYQQEDNLGYYGEQMLKDNEKREKNLEADQTLKFGKKAPEQKAPEQKTPEQSSPVKTSPAKKNYTPDDVIEENEELEEEYEEMEAAEDVLKTDESGDLSPEDKFLDEDFRENAYLEDAEANESEYEDAGPKMEARKSLIDKALANTYAAVKTEKDEHPEFYATKELAEERVGLIKNAIEVNMGLKPADGPEAKMAKEHPQPGLGEGEKTLTDLFKGKDGMKISERIGKLAEMGFIRDSKGMEFPKPEKPWDSYDRVNAALKGDGILVNDQKDVRMVKQNPDTQEIKIDEKTKFASKNLMKSDIKKDTIEMLRKVTEKLDSIGTTKRDSKEYTAMADKIKASIDKLGKTNNKLEFKQILNEVAEKAGDYLLGKTNQKAYKKRTERMECARDVEDIFKAVLQDKSPKEKLEDPKRENRTLRESIAGKMVKTFAEMYKDSKNPEQQKMAQGILGSPREFQKQIHNLLQDPAFQTLFGNDKHPVPDERLADFARASGKDLLQAGLDKMKEMGAEERQREYQANLRQNKPSKGPVNEEQIKDFGEFVHNLKEALENGSWGSSPEYQDFKHELDVCDMQFELGMNPAVMRKAINMLADKADAYTMKCLGDSQHFDAGIERLDLINSVRIAADNLEQNKKPQENQPKKEDEYKLGIAGKIVMNVVKQLLDGTDAQKIEAEKLQNNPKLFNAKREDIINSDAFKELVNGLKEKDLKDLLKLDPKKVNNQFLKAENKVQQQRELQQKIKSREELEKKQPQQGLENSQTV